MTRAKVRMTKEIRRESQSRKVKTKARPRTTMTKAVNQEKGKSVQNPGKGKGKGRTSLLCLQQAWPSGQRLLEQCEECASSFISWGFESVWMD